MYIRSPSLIRDDEKGIVGWWWGTTRIDPDSLCTSPKLPLENETKKKLIPESETTCIGIV